MRIYVIFFLLGCSYALTEVVVILGCANRLIQRQRVEVGLNYIKKSSYPKILYLSGGIKDEAVNTISESIDMLNELKKHKINAQIICDEKSKNTAENFVNLKNWINKNKLHDLYSYVIITSDFHKNRALKLFKGIFNDKIPKIIVSESECNECWVNEKIYSQNIESDIMNAIILLD